MSPFFLFYQSRDWVLPLPGCSLFCPPFFLGGGVSCLFFFFLVGEDRPSPFGPSILGSHECNISGRGTRRMPPTAFFFLPPLPFPPCTVRTCLFPLVLTSWQPPHTGWSFFPARLSWDSTFPFSSLFFPCPFRSRLFASPIRLCKTTRTSRPIGGREVPWIFSLVPFNGVAREASLPE